MAEPSHRGNGLTPTERFLSKCLLRLYPEAFREETGDQWLDFLDQQRREVRYHTRFLGAFRFWTDVIRDLARSVPLARREAREMEEENAGRRTTPAAAGLLLKDLRFALRTLRRRPLFTGMAILTLGLGIGSATAMFSVVDGVLLARRPYTEPDRLVSIWQAVDGIHGFTPRGETRLDFPQYEALNRRSTVFQGVAVYAGGWGVSTLSGDGPPGRVTVGAATASLLPVLGVTPALGRWFLPREESADQGTVAVLNYDTWVGRYGGDRGILGRTVTLNDLDYTVVGVLPPGFRIQWLSTSIARDDDPGPRDFWVPAGSPEWPGVRGSAMWEAVGRLREGITRERAEPETTLILAENCDWGRARAILVPRVEDENRGIGSPLLLLFGATGILLLISCGNVAALSLGEAHGRVHEVATRTAMGAGRWQIARQFLTESVLLGLAGSGLGAAMAFGGIRFLVAMAPPIPRMELVTVNLTVLLFAASAGTLSGVLFGTSPALLVARDGVERTLRSGGRGGARRRTGMGHGFLAGQIGLAVMVVVASGLLVRSFTRLMEVPLGFDPAGVATVRVEPPRGRLQLEPGAGATFMDEVLREMQGIPGLRQVSAVNSPPFPGNVAGWSTRLRKEDSTYVMPKGYHVAPGYLDFMRIPILEGRGIEPSDRADTQPVMVVSRSLARALWGQRSPVGETLYYSPRQVTVVGVAGDVRQSVLQDDPPMAFYVPFAQHARSYITFLARPVTQGTDLIPAMREAIWRVDGTLAIMEAGYLDDAIAGSAAEERFRTTLMGLFAGLASLLAVVGIMGVTARQVSQRTREMGIRKALGARDAPLLGTVVGYATLAGGIGIALGLLGSFWMRPVLAAYLFGLESVDLPTYTGVGLLFLAASALASYLPARRVLRVDPVTVLKEE